MLFGVELSSKEKIVKKWFDEYGNFIGSISDALA
jgi:hypothetical protein